MVLDGVDISNSCRDFQLPSVLALEGGLDFVVTDDNIVSLVSVFRDVGHCWLLPDGFEFERMLINS